MKFSDMKLVAKNAVRAYFVRSWSIEDLMNNGEIPQQAYKSLKKRTRVLLLMIAAFSIGASIGIFIKYFVDIDHGLVYTLLAPPTFAIGFLWFGSMFTRERSDIYLGCVYYCWALCFSTFVVSNADYVGSRAAHFLYKVCIVLALFLGYIVVYTQEILYDAHFGEINFVNRTLTIVFRLPGIVVHAARLCLIQCIIEQHR
ncbi:bax inhibitor 1-like isoform X2 [Solanum lycopersicum]|uniref:bax inhibitor 1-like isoform X2 n=1 Tax=Solanum lycopersicum TaxID=4081 RepID=UPI0002761D50|nr:bax inhibitor 1-like isoform X2 [Solanum lycopersicum]